jgi:hypothetical protein
MARGEQPLFSTPGDETEAGKMAKKVATFRPGESETDDVVRRWLDRQGIDQSLVSGYSIFRHQGEVPRIMVEMYFDDAPREADVTGLDKTERETVPTVSRETVKPEPSLVTVLRADHRTGMHANQPNLHCPLCFSGRDYLVGERGPEEINMPLDVSMHQIKLHTSSPGVVSETSTTIAAAYANAHADGLHKGDGFSPNCSACQQDKKEG